MVAILWVYYSTQVFFFGACIGAAIHGRGKLASRNDEADRSG